MKAEETTCGLLGVMGISEVGVTEDVENVDAVEGKEAWEADGVGKVEVVCTGVPEEGPVVCGVLETENVGVECVVNGV